MAGCSGNPAGPSAPTEIPIPIEGVGGSSDVDVASSFVYTFSQPVQTSTVTTSTFFISGGAFAGASGLSISKSHMVDLLCDASMAIAAEVSCSSSTSCMLDPMSDLEHGTPYTICLTSEILYEDGSAFEAVMIAFMTVAADGPGTANCGGVSCADVFSSSSCNNGMGSTDAQISADPTILAFDYPTLLYLAMDPDGFIVSALGGEELTECIAAEAHAAGETGCIGGDVFSSLDTALACSYGVTYNERCIDLDLDAAQPLTATVSEATDFCVRIITVESGLYTILLNTVSGSAPLYTLTYSVGDAILPPDRVGATAQGQCAVWTLDAVLPYELWLEAFTTPSSTIELYGRRGVAECPAP